MENNIVNQEVQQVVQQEEVDTLSFALSLVSWIPDTFRKITKSEDDIDFVYFAIGVSMVLLAIRKKNMKNN